MQIIRNCQEAIAVCGPQQAVCKDTFFSSAVGYGFAAVSLSAVFFHCLWEVFKQHLYSLLGLLSLPPHVMSMIFLISSYFASLILCPMVPLQTVALSPQ